MILTLIGIGMVILGIIFLYISDNLITSVDFIFDVLGGLNFIFGLAISLICFVGIIGSHIDIEIQHQIKSNQIEYESLYKRLEIINSEYEDMSKSELIKDITEWNLDVYDYKYYITSPWTNWMYNKKIADELKYIEYSAEGD